MLKRHKHTPTHLFLDNTAYFITGAIHRKRPLLAPPELKKHLIDIIRIYFERYNWDLQNWVILNNHYHLMGKSRKGKDLPSIMRDIHKASASLITDSTHCERPIWWNYWDYCPRDEEDYWVRTNYLLYNPIKHSYVNNLNNYPFSSFKRAIEDLGREKLVACFQKYTAYKDLVMQETDDDY
jgi:putative transposase